MNAATLLAVFFVPVQYFVIESFVERRRKKSLGKRERTAELGKPELVK
jgi:hypothetical protein